MAENVLLCFHGDEMDSELRKSDCKLFETLLPKGDYAQNPSSRPALAVLCSAVSLIAAPMPAITFSPVSGESLVNGPFTLGWQFSLSTTVTVSGLGAFNRKFRIGSDSILLIH
jgi:hypothetical protein